MSFAWVLLTGNKRSLSFCKALLFLSPETSIVRSKDMALFFLCCITCCLSVVDDGKCWNEGNGFVNDACVFGFISSRGTAGKDSKVILVDFTDGTSVSTANAESVFLFLLSGTGTAGIDGNAVNTGLFIFFMISSMVGTSLFLKFFTTSSNVFPLSSLCLKLFITLCIVGSCLFWTLLIKFSIAGD